MSGGVEMAATMEMDRGELLRGGRRRRIREQTIRGALYVGFGAAVVGVAIFADWGQLQRPIRKRA
jgi:hypothetical protein